MMESDAGNPTGRINSVYNALLGISQELPKYEVCLGPPTDMLSLTFPPALPGDQIGNLNDGNAEKLTIPQSGR